MKNSPPNCTRYCVSRVTNATNSRRPTLAQFPVTDSRRGVSFSYNFTRFTAIHYFHNLPALRPAGKARCAFPSKRWITSQLPRLFCQVLCSIPSRNCLVLCTRVSKLHFDLDRQFRKGNYCERIDGNIRFSKASRAKSGLATKSELFSCLVSRI